MAFLDTLSGLIDTGLQYTLDKERIKADNRLPAAPKTVNEQIVAKPAPAAPAAPAAGLDLNQLAKSYGKPALVVAGLAGAAWLGKTLLGGGE